MRLIPVMLNGTFNVNYLLSLWMLLSINDWVVSFLKSRLNQQCFLPCDGECFHIRCAHIINLVVQSAYDLIMLTIGKLRLGVKYVKQSTHGRKKF